MFEESTTPDLVALTRRMFDVVRLTARPVCLADYYNNRAQALEAVAPRSSKEVPR